VIKWKYVIGWFPLVLIAIANGTLRQIAFQQALGELHAHQLSTVIGIVLFGVYIYWYIRRSKLQSMSEGVQIGILWMLLTIAFEFGLGRLVLGRDWSVLLHDYNLLEGRVWVLVLIWVAVAPSVCCRIINRSSAVA
jgi:hypothetical protein